MTEQLFSSRACSSIHRFFDSISFFRLGISDSRRGYQQSRQILGQGFTDDSEYSFFLMMPEPKGDGFVDMLDFAAFADNWLAGVNP